MISYPDYRDTLDLHIFWDFAVGCFRDESYCEKERERQKARGETVVNCSLLSEGPEMLI